jgi:hypothetical protein
MMKAGTYYVGDLCYVMHPEWDEVCDLIIDGHTCLDGEFNLKDGRRFAIFSTQYGDGEYRSNRGTMHSVDAGSIGCILLEDIRDPEANEARMKGLGAIVEFKESFATSSDYDGTIVFGDMEIYTGDDPEDDACF